MDLDSKFKGVFLRKELHKEYGGNNQSGISNCAKQPFIFIFTYHNNKSGYIDLWKNGFYFYSGEGKEGSMKFKNGNKSIRDHHLSNKQIFLFESLGKGKVKFISEVGLEGYKIEI